MYRKHLSLKGDLIKLKRPFLLISHLFPKTEFDYGNTPSSPIIKYEKDIQRESQTKDIFVCFDHSSYCFGGTVIETALKV
jgi:hypothetical protein